MLLNSELLEMLNEEGCPFHHINLPYLKYMLLSCMKFHSLKKKMLALQQVQHSIKELHMQLNSYSTGSSHLRKA